MGVVENEQNAARNDLRQAAAKIAAGQAELRIAVHRAGDAKLAQVEIAKLAGISRPTVAKWLDEEVEYREFGEALGWDKDRPLTEPEQDDVG